MLSLFLLNFLRINPIIEPILFLREQDKIALRMPMDLKRKSMKIFFIYLGTPVLVPAALFESVLANSLYQFSFLSSPIAVE